MSAPLVPKATERRTGGFRRMAGFDSSRPYGTATLGASRERAQLGSAGQDFTTTTAWESKVGDSVVYPPPTSHSPGVASSQGAQPRPHAAVSSANSHLKIIGISAADMSLTPFTPQGPNGVTVTPSR